MNEANHPTSNERSIELRAFADILRDTGRYGVDFADVERASLLSDSADEIDRQRAEIERLTRELRLAESARDYANAMLDKATSSDETGEVLPSLEWQVTYDVVAYNESWGGYGDNASKEGFQSAEQAIAYAKPLEAHLNAQVWQRTTPKPVPTISVKVWPPENGKGDR